MSDPTLEAVMAYVKERKEKVKTQVLMHLLCHGPSTTREIYDEINKTELGRDISLQTLKKMLKAMVTETDSVIESKYELINNRQHCSYQYKNEESNARST